MNARLLLIVLFLAAAFMATGCNYYQKQHARNHVDSVTSDFKTFNAEFRHYAFDTPAPEQDPAQKDQNVFKHMWISLKAMHYEIDHFLLGMDVEGERLP